MIWIWAMGQAFFSLSVTGSGMIVYGAYLSQQEDVVGVAQHTALFDTIAAVVAALVIIPACFSYGLDVGAGPGLLFVTLPTILQDIPLGQLFAVILYIAMIFAGVSSLQNMFEAVAESLQHRFPRGSAEPPHLSFWGCCVSASGLVWRPFPSGAHGWILFLSISFPSVLPSVRFRGSM